MTRAVQAFEQKNLSKAKKLGETDVQPSRLITAGQAIPERLMGKERTQQASDCQASKGQHGETLAG